MGRLLKGPSAIGRYEARRSGQDDSGIRVAVPAGEREIVDFDMIITQAVWDKLQAMLAAKTKEPENVVPVHLFTGLVWCHCGQKMKVVSEGAKLDCPAGHAKIPATDLKAIFLQDFFDVITDHPALAAAMSAPSEHRSTHSELAHASMELQEAEKRREGIETMSGLSQQRFKELHGPAEKTVRSLQTQLQALQDKLKGATPPGFSLSDWQKLWTAKPLKQKRELLSTFVERVQVCDGEIEIAYFLSDSSQHDLPAVPAPDFPTNYPPTGLLYDGGRTYIRLPKPGQRCPISSFSRSKLNQLNLKNERNHFAPPVASVSDRQVGAGKGARLIVKESLIAYLANLK